MVISQWYRRLIKRETMITTIPQEGVSLRISFIIYNEMTALDFVGIYDPLTRLKTMGFMPDLEWEICSMTEEVLDITGLRFTPTKVMEPLGSYDMIVVPGGFGSRKLVQDKKFIEWLRTAKPCKYKVSVCTGSVLLGAAGFLKGKKATTHRTAFDELREFATVVDQRIVDEGDVITARGVSSSIDLGLYICEKLAGREVKEKIRRQMDYYRPSHEPAE
jgi:cyclohexyl-isocyanide hydratase